MNRNLDGTELTTDQLRAMAATTEAGRKALSSVAGVHYEGFVRGPLLDATLPLRQAEWRAGRLKFSTRSTFTPETPDHKRASMAAAAKAFRAEMLAAGLVRVYS